MHLTIKSLRGLKTRTKFLNFEPNYDQLIVKVSNFRCMLPNQRFELITRNFSEEKRQSKNPSRQDSSESLTQTFWGEVPSDIQGDFPSDIQMMATAVKHQVGRVLKLIHQYDHFEALITMHASKIRYSDCKLDTIRVKVGKRCSRQGPLRPPMEKSQK